MCIDVESTAEADGDGRHLAATCQPDGKKKLNSSRGRRESGGGAQLFAENRRRVRRRPASWREGGGREREGARERERGREGRRGREEGREREGGRERDEREGGGRAGERKTFLLPPLLATEAISVPRRGEERGEGRAAGERKTFLLPELAREGRRGREEGREREGGGRERESGREEDFPPPASSPGAPQLVRPRRQHREHHPQLVLR